MTKTIFLCVTGLALLAATGCDDSKKADPTAKVAPAKADEGAKKTDKADKGKEDKGKEKAAEPAAEQDPHAAFTNLSPDQLESMVAQEGCVPVDANGDATRAKYGTVPGAVLLSSYKEFKDGELPEKKDTKLVFYCGGEACTAAPKAAAVAKSKGYTDVSVMRAGIKGWVDAGKKVEKSKEG
ncbi:MAG: rhodanese-like domain-containing protein [Myxococcota bacterium]